MKDMIYILSKDGAKYLVKREKNLLVAYIVFCVFTLVSQFGTYIFSSIVKQTEEDKEITGKMYLYSQLST